MDEWLDWRLRRIAIHEHMEWLRRDGELLNDPHAEEIDQVPPDSSESLARAK